MSISSLRSSQSDPALQFLRQRRDTLKPLTGASKSDDSSRNKAPSASQPSSDTGNPFRATMKNDLSALMRAVQAGDPARSQAAPPTLKPDLAALPSSATSPVSGNHGPTAGAVLQDLANVLKAVGSGDATVAQSAATALQADIRSVLGAIAPSGPAGSPKGNFVSDLGLLISSAQSGDVSSAQKAAANLASDLQKAIGSPDRGHDGHHPHHKANAQPADPAASVDPTSQGAPQVHVALSAGAEKALKAAIDAYDPLRSFAATLLASTTG
ncbi:MAG: hypothetical protein JWM36_408 [Hyphomicrobiales bacterium]|nr:hypothetical protein [Hyphomicrobiales bacterium]